MRLHTPYCYRYINRGISGNRIVGLYDRMVGDSIRNFLT